MGCRPRLLTSGVVGLPGGRFHGAVIQVVPGLSVRLFLTPTVPGAKTGKKENIHVICLQNQGKGFRQKKITVVGGGNPI
jgi:hypothetical protein